MTLTVTEDIPDHLVPEPTSFPTELVLGLPGDKCRRVRSARIGDL